MLVLNVWFEASTSPIGHLVKGDDGSLAFAYTADWIAHPQRHPLSLSLPLSDEPFGDLPVRAYFDNLLQENDQLQSLMSREGIERTDVAELLRHLGADCAGAVSVLPVDHGPIKRPGNIAEDYDLLDDALFADMIRRLATGRPLPDELRDPSPVAGVRPKISLADLGDGSFGFPKRGSGAPTTHILKLPDPNHRHEARDEAFATELAEKCGFRVGKSIASDVNGHEVLLIQRFDRVVEGGLITRIHQEDFAQAAGLPAELKYERRGRPGRRFDASVIGKILAATDQPALMRETFLGMTLFNLLIGNNDNHAKNNAILLGFGGTVTMAPFYDIVPVQTVAGFKADLAFRIGSATLREEVSAADLLKFCTDIGVPEKGAPRILRRVARGLVRKLEGHSADFPREMSALDRLLGDSLRQFNEVLDLGIDVRGRDAHVIEGGGWALS